jgi:hypothetical protein
MNFDIAERALKFYRSLLLRGVPQHAVHLRSTDLVFKDPEPLPEATRQEIITNAANYQYFFTFRRFQFENEAEADLEKPW